MDHVQHFELPYKNRDRAKKFYFQAFGWQIFDTPGSGYSFVSTVEMDPKGMPKKPGAINGGLLPRGKQVTGPTLFVKVGDIKAHLERIRHAGGTVLTEPQAQGPVWFARFRDPEGNLMTVFQQNPAAREDRDAVVKKATKGRPKKAVKGKSGAAARASGKKPARKASTKGIKPQRKSTAGARPAAVAKPRKAKAPREPTATWSR